MEDDVGDVIRMRILRCSVSFDTVQTSRHGASFWQAQVASSLGSQLVQRKKAASACRASDPLNGPCCSMPSLSAFNCSCLSKESPCPYIMSARSRQVATQGIAKRLARGKTLNSRSTLPTVQGEEQGRGRAARGEGKGAAAELLYPLSTTTARICMSKMR